MQFKQEQEEVRRKQEEEETRRLEELQKQLAEQAKIDQERQVELSWSRYTILIKEGRERGGLNSRVRNFAPCENWRSCGNNWTNRPRLTKTRSVAPFIREANVWFPGPPKQGSYSDLGSSSDFS